MKFIYIITWCLVVITQVPNPSNGVDKYGRVIPSVTLEYRFSKS